MSAYLGLLIGIDFGNLFEPDALISARFYETTRRSPQANPELRLMAAVLEDAVASLITDQRRCTSQRRREFADALEWIAVSDDNDWLFSFTNICDALGINPAHLRQGLLRKIAESRDSTRMIHPKDHLGCHSPRRKLIRLRAE
jgi:hypothetical protein